MNLSRVFLVLLLASSQAQARICSELWSIPRREGATSVLRIPVKGRFIWQSGQTAVVERRLDRLGFEVQVSSLEPAAKKTPGKSLKWKQYLHEYVDPLIEFSNREFERRGWGDFVKGRHSAAHRTAGFSTEVSVRMGGRMVGAIRFIRGKFTDLPVSQYLKIKLEDRSAEGVEIASFAIANDLPPASQAAVRLKLITEVLSRVGVEDTSKHSAPHFYTYGDRASLKLYKIFGFEPLLSYSHKGRSVEYSRKEVKKHPIEDRHGIRWWPMRATRVDLLVYLLMDLRRVSSRSSVPVETELRRDSMVDLEMVLQAILNSRDRERTLEATGHLIRLMEFADKEVDIAKEEMKLEELPALIRLIGVLNKVSPWVAQASKSENPLAREAASFIYRAVLVDSSRFQFSTTTTFLFDPSPRVRRTSVELLSSEGRFEALADRRFMIGMYETPLETGELRTDSLARQVRKAADLIRGRCNRADFERAARALDRAIESRSEEHVEKAVEELGAVQQLYHPYSVDSNFIDYYTITRYLVTHPTLGEVFRTNFSI